jgi:hypothetical protein
MKKNERLGATLTFVGALLGILGTFLIFMKWYGPALHAEAAEPGCEILLKSIMPALLDVAVVAGVLYALSGYGFLTGSRWAFRLAVIANVLALQGSFFINVPFMAADMPPVYFIVFMPNVLLYFLLMKLVGRLSWSRTLTGLLTGMTFVFTLMNGIASWSRIITIGAPIFVAVQRLHWVSMIGWGIVTVQTLLRPREWARIVGIGAALLEVVVGIPLAINTAVQLERFSLFALAPIFSGVLLVLLLWPGLWQRLTASSGSAGEWIGAQAESQVAPAVT